MKDGLKRRDFLTEITAGAGAAMLAGAAAGQSTVSNAEVPYRTLGHTGEKVSCIGLGGHHIGRPKDPEEGIRIIRTALDRGVNFLDNCWDYNGGESEVRMGNALRDGYRQKAFLMTKIDGRDKKAASAQIDESLRRLQTDHLDLLQHHEIIRFEDPDRIFAPGGAMEAALEAKKAGKVRYIGFTGHKDPQVHLRMLEVANQNHFLFDSVQMPLNVMDAHFRSFEKLVIPELVRQNIGVLGMKSMGDKIILSSNVVTPLECLHYALNLPTSVVITGCERMEILDQAIQAAHTFRKIPASELKVLLEKTRESALSGKYELFKTTSQFDGTAQNPKWLG